MCNHKPLCFLMGLLLFVGGLNWGLVGLGSFLGTDLNVVHMLLGAWAWLENAVYLLVGLAALMYGYFFLTHGKECGCHAGCGSALNPTL
mgnify:CR=1 FL=1